MNNYQKAIRYATKLVRDYNAPYNPKDLVHDAYIQYNTYTGNDLFDSREGTIMKTVKNFHLNNVNKGYISIGSREDRKMGKVEKRRRERMIISDDFERNDENHNETTSKHLIPEERNNPESIMINGENEKDFSNSLCEYDRKVLNLKLQGYMNKEIFDILDTHNVAVTKAIKNIKKQMHTNSPFRGSKLIIIKRIKRNEFEKNKEILLKDWEMGEESDYNESFVQMTSKLNPMEGLLIKERDSD